MGAMKAMRRYIAARASATRCQPIHSNSVQHLAYTKDSCVTSGLAEGNWCNAWHAGDAIVSAIRRE